LRLANILDPKSYYRVEHMKFGGKRPNLDKSTVIYNANITMTDIPLGAYDYVVNGKPARMGDGAPVREDRESRRHC
jgi:predicted helicase